MKRLSGPGRRFVGAVAFLYAASLGSCALVASGHALPAVVAFGCAVVFAGAVVWYGVRWIHST